MPDNREVGTLVTLEARPAVAHDEGDDGVGTFRPYTTITATTADGSQYLGELDPPTLRSLAMQFLEVAEASVQDAAMLGVLTGKMELSLEAATSFTDLVRAMRAGD